MKDSITKNPKTTTIGILVFLLGIVPTFIPQYAGVCHEGVVLLGSIGLLMSKDGNVTGGTVPATKEAAKRMVNPVTPAGPSKFIQIMGILFSKAKPTGQAQLAQEPIQNR